jgi:superfamily II DNA or RNA helicase
VEVLFQHEDQLKSLLRVVDDFGFQSYDLVGLPRRLCVDDTGPLVEAAVDRRRVSPVESPAALVVKRALPAQENWLSVSHRTLARVYSAFLVAEDPQRRIEARKAATLMHQVSLVQHILSRNDLKKVLIGDEVGLGKTIEAGLLVRQLIDQNPSLRVLYLAPARLVHNVAHEFRDKLDIDARKWVAGSRSDARINDDKIVIASINKAVFGDNLDTVANSGPWDVVIVDECHHLSDWDPAGGKPNQSFKLVTQLSKNLPSDGRLMLLSGTPHQGSEARFKNILKLLSDDGKDLKGAAGRVIFRTKDRVRDWSGAPLFPAREIRKPVVVELGARYDRWYCEVGTLYDGAGSNGVTLRAVGWAKGQALQWAASSVQAGLGFLVRLGMRRLNWTLESEVLGDALKALRPYRGGAPNEPLPSLFDRIQRQMGLHVDNELSDEDEEEWDEDIWRPDAHHLATLIRTGIALIKSDAATAKWDAVCKLIDEAGEEKVVLFAQPVETVTVVADVLERRYGQRPALIIGNQSDEERTEQVNSFQSIDGPRFLVSSKAGGEGLNMQKARRLIHLDVPWNPMDLEQRIGRVHRFGSRKTVIIDTVVAAGSREVDMYRVAREKLLMIAKHLDPDQFETLFSRVMSLVPPKELECILGDVRTASAIDDHSANEIGRLVTAGFKSWSAFDEVYRKQADEIRSANPGEATWADLGAFLVRFAGAKDGDGATFSSFTFADEEIVAVDETVPSIGLAGQQFVCGDTGGLPAVTSDGGQAKPLGLNVSEVQSALRASFAPGAQLVGPAYLKLSAKTDLPLQWEGPVTALFFLRQRIQQEAGLWTEKALTLHVTVVAQDGRQGALNSKGVSTLVRAMSRASRMKDPGGVALPADLEEIELSLAQGLRRPSDEDVVLGVRYAVWPIAAAVMLV